MTWHATFENRVLILSKKTTNVRIIYDASSKVRKGLKSLNKCLYPRPVLVPNLCGILLQFRMHKIDVAADVEIAFLQIGLYERDRESHVYYGLKIWTKK